MSIIVPRIFLRTDAHALYLCVMKTVSIMEAQHNLAKVLRAVEEGQRMIITRRRKKVAEIVPLEAEGPLRMPDFARRASDIWGEQWQGASSDHLLDESRGDR